MEEVWYVAKLKLMAHVVVDWRNSSWWAFLANIFPETEISRISESVWFETVPSQCWFSIWNALPSVTTRWQHKPVSQTSFIITNLRSVAVWRTQICFLSIHTSLATFCTLAPLYWLCLFTVESFPSQPREKGFYLWPTGNYLPVNKGVLDSLIKLYAMCKPILNIM